MARSESWKYRMRFDSFDGKLYEVRIYVLPSEYTGTIISLTGAEVPFETSEDDDSDIFTPVRGQTGYLRIVTGNAQLLEELMPQNNMQHRVELHEIMPSGRSKGIKWNGWMQADCYEQPWGNYARMLEFPLRSMLSSLKDRYVTDSSGMQSIAEFLLEAFPWMTDVRIWYPTHPYGNDKQPPCLWMPTVLQYSKETIVNEGTEATILSGMSYYEILEDLCKLFGLMAREDGNIIYMFTPDRYGLRGWPADGYIWMRRYTRAILESIANHGGNTSTTVQYFFNNLDVLTLRGDDARMSYALGKSKVKITLPVELNSDALAINVPDAPEDSDGYNTVNCNQTGTAVYIKTYDFSELESQHVSMTSEYAEFRVTGDIANPYTLNGAGTMADMIAQSPITSPYMIPQGDVEYGFQPKMTGQNLTIGAAWIRYAALPQGKAPTKLETGILLQTVCLHGYYDGQLDQVRSGFPLTLQNNADAQNINAFKITNNLSASYKGQYININFRCDSMTFNPYAEYNEEREPLYTLSYGDSQNGLRTQLFMSVCIRNEGSGSDYCWNGSQWEAQPQGYNANGFNIRFDSSGNMVSNKTDDMQVDASGGYFIKVPDSIEVIGRIEVGIKAWSMRSDEPEEALGVIHLTRESHSHIISQLEVKVLPEITPLVSDRTENIYFSPVSDEGFSDRKDVDLLYGSKNNNPESPSFLRYYENGQYLPIEQIIMYDMMNPGSGQEHDYRPELEVLDRMKLYYDRTHKVYSMEVKDDKELAATFLSYNNALYLPVIIKHNWRDGVIKLKLIDIG